MTRGLRYLASEAATFNCRLSTFNWLAAAQAFGASMAAPFHLSFVRTTAKWE